jgi:hypothetical protein
MLNSHKRMIEKHTWTAVAHNSLDFLPFFFPVAMDRTRATHGLVFAKGAMIQALV